MIKNFDIWHESYWFLKVVKLEDDLGDVSKFEMKTRCYTKNYFKGECNCHRYTIWMRAVKQWITLRRFTQQIQLPNKIRICAKKTNKLLIIVIYHRSKTVWKHSKEAQKLNSDLRHCKCGECLDPPLLRSISSAKRKLLIVIPPHLAPPAKFPYVSCMIRSRKILKR